MLRTAGQRETVADKQFEKFVDRVNDFGNALEEEIPNVDCIETPKTILTAWLFENMELENEDTNTLDEVLDKIITS